jgi:hypothetical protein
MPGDCGVDCPEGYKVPLPGVPVASLNAVSTTSELPHAYLESVLLMEYILYFTMRMTGLVLMLIALWRLYYFLDLLK